MLSGMALSPGETLALALNPALMLRAQGYEADEWQRDFLLSSDRQTLLNCSRQSGKSTVVASLALHTALFRPGSLTLLLAPSQRQAHELFRKVLDAYNALGRPVPTEQDAQTLSKLELANGSRIIGLPGKEGTIRGYSKAALLLIDEAARVPDDLYRSVRPMLAVSGGRLVALSTPFGQRGWFWREWENPNARFKKVRITWQDCPRISAEFIAGERASMGDAWVGQEFECQFGSLQGIVYPEFEEAVWDVLHFPPQGELAGGSCWGGIDWGWRNPFAALWGWRDRDDVLWIVGERYLRETPLHQHVAALKQQGARITWVADPAGRTEIEECRAAGMKVVTVPSEIQLGIAAVTARIRTKRLRVSRVNCPNLIEESKLYRYAMEGEARLRGQKGETPVDQDNHALAALRYMVTRLDRRFIARLRRLQRQDMDLSDDEALAQIEEAERQRAERRRETQRSVFGVDPDLWDDEDVWELP